MPKQTNKHPPNMQLCEPNNARLRDALDAWTRWYANKIGRITEGNNLEEDYTGYEQDLFEALGCVVAPRKQGKGEERYVINATGFTQAVSDLVIQFRAQSAGIGKFKGVCHDGSVVTIELKDKKPKAKDIAERLAAQFRRNGQMR